MNLKESKAHMGRFGGRKGKQKMLVLFVAQEGVGASWRCDCNLGGVKLRTKD